MSTMTKVFVVLTAVLAIAVSCLFIAAAAQWDNWKDLAEDYQKLAEGAISKAQNVDFAMQAALTLKDQEISDIQRALADTQKNRQELADDLARAKSDLAKARNEALAFEAGRTKLQEILGVTTGELKALQKQNQGLLGQNIDLQTRNSRLNSRVLDLTTNVTILTDQVRNIQEKLYAAEQQAVELQQRLVAGRPVPAEPETPGAVPVALPVKGPIEGEILQVEGNYAGISVGETSGVVPGMVFMVYREGGGYLADLVIDRVRPKESGGKLSTLVKGEVRRGDSVRYPVME
ncbi:MAG TPA: hypothetical protein VM487_23270 [Phycisphaerae bacterium]|nr:hypothetical protein [Phycisphaerae bacterium]